MDYGINRARYELVDPQSAALVARLARIEAWWQRSRNLLRWSFAAVLAASAATLIEALAGAFTRWPGQ